MRAYQTKERPARPMLNVTGGVAEMAQVLAARHVRHAPDRLVRHAEQDAVPAHAGELGEREIGALDVLEDLAAEHEIEAAGREGERVHGSLNERDRILRLRDAQAGAVDVQADGSDAVEMPIE